ncbi:MAG: Thymidylate synthase [Patescibacteria group bacterium]|nr:Thymidylate synthase [Patescibacteria group bacterium]
MKPYSERVPDLQYRNLLEKIMREGVEVKPIQGEKSKMIAGHQMHFLFENGFPLITERDIGDNASIIGKDGQEKKVNFLVGALGEHIGFLHGARTHEELKNWGCSWWKKWVTKEKCDIFGLPEGDLGDGSYGAGWTNFPTKEGPPFNQITEVIRQIKERPYLRTHIITPWIPQYTIQHSELKRKVVVAPCHGWLHVLVFPETKEISVHHFQRSGDIPVGVVFNIVQYASFTMMLAQILGYKPKELVYTISDAHIYESQFEKVKELLQRDARPFPTMVITDTSIKDILDFRPEHFKISDYNPHPAMVIPTPI